MEEAFKMFFEMSVKGLPALQLLISSNHIIHSLYKENTIKLIIQKSLKKKNTTILTALKDFGVMLKSF